MAYWQYSQLSKLPAVDVKALRVREPTCLECGGRLMRVAMRETFDPYHWIPTGWMCSGCTAVYLELT